MRTPRTRGPSVFRATCATAASKPRPDSTEMVSRSIASGSARCIDLGPVVRLLVEVHVRCHVARDGGADHEQHRDDEGEPHQQGQGHRDDQPDGEADDLAGHHPVHRPPRRVAGLLELLPDPVVGVRRGQPAAESLGAGEEREEHPVGEGSLELLLHLLGSGGERVEHRQGTVHPRLLAVDSADVGEGEEHRDEDHRDPREHGDRGDVHRSTFAALLIHRTPTPRRTAMPMSRMNPMGVLNRGCT